MYFIIYNFYKKSKLTFPYHTLGYYDFPETYLRSRKLELLRRKFYKVYLIKQLKKLGISKKEFMDYYFELRNCKDIIRKIYEIQAKVPRSRYGGYPNPEIFYILMRKIKPKIVVENGVSFGVTSSFSFKLWKKMDLGLFIQLICLSNSQLKRRLESSFQKG